MNDCSDVLREGGKRYRCQLSVEPHDWHQFSSEEQEERDQRVYPYAYFEWRVSQNTASSVRPAEGESE